MTHLPPLLGAAKCVFFDFDGPICRLFAAHPAKDVVPSLLSLIGDLEPDLLTPELRASENPHGILHAMAEARPGSPAVRAAARLLSAEEVAAADNARPAPYADPLIRTLVAIGHTVAITSNNSPAAIRRYLHTRGLVECFEPHIHGRREDARGLKPDRDCLLRALESTGATPEECVMIGDTPADFTAAGTAGVGFIGYAPETHRFDELLGAGADVVLPSLEPLLDAARR